MTESRTHIAKSKGEHGTTGAYIIGFILSLIFTVIPYYLVVNKVVSGNVLIAAVLGIAVLQMAIQLLFFLHLGRGPKPLYNIAFFFGTAGIIVIAVGASLFIMNNLYRNMSPGEITLRLAQKESISHVGAEKTGACNELLDNHIVTLSNGLVSPSYIKARVCDTLTFINEDDVEREIAFGIHPARDSYGGEFEVILHKVEPETITLNQPGDFVFRDHNSPQTTGSFSVSDE